MISSPKVSVVIPTYNNAALIHETLDGVRRQTCQDFEIIVVDDGSTDATEQAVRGYDARIHYVNQANQGPAAARNHGVALARGEFIAFLDHDDVWNARHLEALLAEFVRHPSAAMVFDDAEGFGEGMAPGPSHVDRDVARSLVGRAVPIRRVWRCWVASMSVVLIKKSVFNELGGLDPKIWGLDDLHLYLRLAARFELRYVDYIGCRKRMTGNNLLNKVGLKGSVDCLEELYQNHPEVPRAIGAMKFRRRLGRKQYKLGSTYLRNGALPGACVYLWKAYRHNLLNLKYLWRFMQAKHCFARTADKK